MSSHAYCRGGLWFKVGLNLLREATPFDRDYVLCRRDQTGAFLPVPISYVEYCSWMRTTLSKTKLGGGQEMGQAVAAAFTPHSPRGFLPSVLTALGAPETELRWLRKTAAEEDDGPGTDTDSEGSSSTVSEVVEELGMKV